MKISYNPWGIAQFYLLRMMSNKRPTYTDFEHDRQDNSTSISDTPRNINPQQFEKQSVVPLFEGSNTCASSSILIMKYAMKHNITKDDLLDLVRLHCPKPNSCLILF